MPYVASNPETYAGTSVPNGQCVAFVKAAADAPATSAWSEGNKVKGNSIPTGTAIATFQDGSYNNYTDGRSHAAIFIQETADGLEVWDQWSGHKVSKRVIFFRAGTTTPNNDGDAFSVIA